MAALPEIAFHPDESKRPELYIVPDPIQVTVERRASEILNGPGYAQAALERRLEFLGRQTTTEPEQLKAHKYQLDLFQAIHNRVMVLRTQTA